MSNPAPASRGFSAKPSPFTLPAARLLFNLASPQANRLTPHSEGPRISAWPQTPLVLGHSCLQKRSGLSLSRCFFGAQTLPSAEEEGEAGPGSNAVAKSHLSQTQRAGRSSPWAGGARPKQREEEERKRERKSGVWGERGQESERKLPDKQTAAPRLLITLCFRFQTL